MKIALSILILVIALPATAKEQSALEYVTGMLKIENESGVVTKATGELFWPIILESEPTAVAPWHGNTVLLEIELPAKSAMRFLAANGFERDQTMENIAKDIPLLDKLFPRNENMPMYSASFVIPRLGTVEMTAFVDSASAERSKINLKITQHTLHFVLPDKKSAEQVGADQPAAAPQLNSKGKDKPNPKAEVRPR
jgi:hypothetical protein